MKNSFWRVQYKVRNCNNINCGIYKINEPIHLTHIHPSQIKVLIITEQPKIKRNLNVTNINFYQVVNNSSTVNSLEKLLGNAFGNSITNRNGSFYWTHHTKCSHAKRKQQKDCATRFLYDEIESIKNLNLVLSFGTEAFQFLFDNKFIQGNFSGTNFFDYYYEVLVEQSTKNRHQFHLNINNKILNYLPLAHPSSANPLSKLNYKIEPLIKRYLNDAI